MGTTHTDHYETEVIERAEQLKALAHPARVKIFNILLETPGCVCCDLTQKIGLSQPTISQHLKAMRAAGILCGTVEGKSTCYCLNEHVVADLAQFFSTAQAHVCQPQKKCCS